jgi:hypothetical protein
VSDEVTRDVGDYLAGQDRHCRVYWGSHGCDLPRGHDFPLHMCGFGEPGGPHSFHDGTRCWSALWYFEGDDDAPPDGLSEASEP